MARQTEVDETQRFDEERLDAIRDEQRDPYQRTRRARWARQPLHELIVVGRETTGGAP